jgi:cobalt-zinc-cadmium efflux system outer membrane protein
MPFNTVRIILNSRLLWRLASAAALAASLACPQPLGGETLPLTQAIQAAKDRSPDIANLMHQMLAARAQARQALSLADPSVSVAVNDMNGDFNQADAGSTSFGIDQPFTFPGKALLNWAQGKDQAEALEHQLRNTEIQLVINVKTAYYQLALARKNLDLNTEQEKILEQIVSVVKRRYEAAGVTEVDVANAQLAQYANQTSRADLVLAEKTALSQLNVMLGREAEADVEVEALPDPDGVPKVDKVEALTKMKAHNPQILSAASTASAASKGLTLAWMGLLPDFQVGVSDNQYHLASPNYASSPLIETHSFNVQANVPLWALFNESQSILAAGHSNDAARAGLKSQAEQSEQALFAAVETLDDNAAKLALYKDHILPLSEMCMKLALINYGTGKIGFQDLAGAAAGLWSTRSTYYTLLAGDVTAYAQYGQLVGEEL